MSAGERRRLALLRSLSRTGRARLTELARELDASIATIRRDVEILAGQQRLIRQHGWVEQAAGSPRHRAPAAPTIGLVHADNAYLNVIARAAAREAERRGVRFLVEQADGPQASQRAAESLVGQGCAGLLYSPQWPTEQPTSEPTPWPLQLGVPVVLAGREVGPTDPLYVLDSATADHGYGFNLALEHLMGLGHTRIAASVNDTSPPGRLMRRDYLTAVEQRGLDRLGPALMTPTRITPETVADMVSALRELAPTAVVVHTDVFAQRLVHALLAAGVTVPGQLSVIGYDDMVTPVPDLTLTSVSPPKHPLGAEALAVILRRVRLAREGLDRPPVTHVRLLPELVPGTTTGPPPTARRAASAMSDLSD